MKKVGLSDKSRVVNILVASFEDNRSVNYVVKQDQFRLKRIRMLMEYSFDVCYHFGDVYLSDDGHACALILYPDKKKMTLRSVLLDVKFAFGCVGSGNIGKVLKRQRAIKALYPIQPIYYLWFIGVNPEAQGKGIGANLLTALLMEAHIKDRSIYLETSMELNLKFYRKFGFELYHEMEVPHQLFFMRKNSN
jgi:ribosomal protein S18 acetylase RimI-like enzyme